MIHEIDTIPLDAVRINGGTQSRVELNQVTIAEYAEAIRAAVDLPPVVTFFDGVTFWLADGFHRYNAHRDAGAMEIAAEIRTGTQRDAILFSVGANASHGLRRTNEDKRRAVETLLNDPEWRTWTQARIAETCGVSREFVSRLSSAQEPSCDRSQDTVRVVERNGKTYEQNTANIGKSKSEQGGAETATKPAETRMDDHFGPGAEHDVSAQSGQVSNAAAAGPVQEVGSELVDDFGPSPEEIAAAVRAEAEQLEYIKNLLASDDDPLALALADLKQKGLDISALRSQNAGHQNTINDQIRMIKSLRSKLAKLERTV
ncbi:hypothetical protein CR105_24510 [Massilia eurypsychrophila]|uniref:ParB-like N-terminal domain-containing protein n=1 Tax=Massilia eurypsychrophila TaxID=1485217 RepID=A0A2G8T8L7_9BURK|nr:ParB/RepB/Spo0J family partition protein [Massilia eurypsychrophila]PIL42352.1 hypothetical protein CR105_24510 [Massilia eurypsychrophila]